MLSSSTYSCFRAASQDVMKYLHDRLGFGLWMVTRTKGRDWVVLEAEDHGYSVQGGDVFQWADSFCSRMVKGEGPRIAPESDKVPAYVEAPIGSVVPIGAYIGIPLNRLDGELFGTLCAIDPQPQPADIVNELPHIELMARLLETILESECKANDEARRAERAEAQALSDHLTGVFNRRGWDQLLASEEKRCAQFSHPAVVLSVDLDGLKVINDTEGHSSGDQLICRAAHTLRDNVRKNDIVARIGGDEFLILGVECKEFGAEIMADRIGAVLTNSGIAASIGYATRDPKATLQDACKSADDAMYVCKRERKLAAEAHR